MCRFPASGSSWKSFARGGVAHTIRDSPGKKVSKVGSHLVSVLASSAIRCRFVDRFVRLKFSPMFPGNGSLRMAPLFPRSGPGESSSPMSTVVLRCYDFPARIPGRLFDSLPGPTLPSSVRVSQLALALSEGRRVPSGPGSLFNRRPDCRFALTWT
jgi:hypothetical protein